MKYLKTFVSAILAGLCIGIGGVVFLSVDDKLTGSFFFTLGLFVICSMGFHLFTGKVCYVFQNDKTYNLSIPVIWGGNLVGTFAVAKLMLMTRAGGNISGKAQALCGIKLDDSYISLFVLGIFCNILIFIAVDGYKNIPYELGKYLSLFFGVIVFILCGFEHCVADMFYFSAAEMWSTEALLRLLVITFGNAVGGVFVPFVRDRISEKKE
ncbi:formate/nitrite transporter family protein [Oribacterium sp. WCC10]|uniref:formate/nitrite transporter family protein n=1 Tax=Oribacterium sp. WCC10 TaxID=1855343 RepID=UPI0008DF3FDF|nr:formate/nitrite transporter family protein [Oribacterium sp. WCC10]SFG36278.1 Formate/nitrite transporter FocA, FNT family [Oribacterium sp. WCC10]